jgi:adenine-specific DNA-methyltransferase
MKSKINYIGSKIKLLPWIEQVVADFSKKTLEESVFCDLFAGTHSVGKWFKPKVKQCISNDLEFYSFCFGKSYIERNSELSSVELILDELNSLPLKSGIIYNEYSQNGASSRLFFSEENGKKIDALRERITNSKFDELQKFYILTSLLEASDRVANTASVYGAFLKKIKKTASKSIKLLPLETFKGNGLVFQEDANSLIKKISGDVLYLDPPYNQRQYGSNYHLLNTIASLENTLKIKGKTGLPVYNKSKFCSKNSVESSFEELIKNSNFNLILMSYNNDGLLRCGEIKKIMEKYGKYHLERKQYDRFKADNNRENNNKRLYEYLHILEK